MGRIDGTLTLTVGLMGAGVLLWLSVGDAGPAVAQRGFQRPPGEVLLNRYCLDCHDLTPIRTQALDLEGWSDTVDTMIGEGALIEPEEVPVLTDYLAGTYLSQPGPYLCSCRHRPRALGDDSVVDAQ